MEFLSSYKLTGRRVLVITTVLFGSLIILSLIANTFRGLSRDESGMKWMDTTTSVGAPDVMSYPQDNDGYYGYELSARNIAPTMPPYGGGYTSGDSEAFEVKNYNAHIETNDFDRDCAVITALKSRAEVIFENTSTYDRGCSFTFKVEKAQVDSVLAVLESLNPKELNENVYTIKNEVDDYTSEIDILTKKLASLDQAYNEALTAYAGITDMATRNGDVENLAKIIESKLTLIERLTQSRMQVASDLERMDRAKAESLDRLTYTHFSVSVTERVYVDREEIRDSWQYAIASAIRDANTLLQDATVGLIIFIIMVLKFILYALIVLVVVRFGWGFIKRGWEGMKTKTNE
jgi:hypothetical protein